MCKQFQLEWIRNEILLYRIGNHIWSPVIENDGGQCEKNVYKNITGSLFCTAEIDRTVQNNRANMKSKLVLSKDQ